MNNKLDQSLDTISILTKQLNGMLESLIQMLPSLAIALVVLFITWIVGRFSSKITYRITKKSNMRPSLRELCETIVRLGIWAFGLMTTLTVLLPGMTPASLVAGFGFGAIAIGFAFQDIFENFLAGVLLMLREKMRIGDYIECEGIEGNVEQILLRETHIRRPSAELTVVPNSILFKNPVKILTDVETRRHEIIVGVSYDSDLEQAKQVILDAVKTVGDVDQDKNIDVFACEFNSSSIDFRVRWWSGSKKIDMHKSRDSVIRATKRALDDAGIEIPFPYVTHTFKEPIPMLIEKDDD